MSASTLRPDLALIAAQVPAGARILDVGCGDGTLMAALRDSKDVDVRGLEIDPANVAAAMEHGLAVVQGDADRDLADYPDDSFDIAILSQTLQTSHRPDRIVDQLLRIAPRAFVSFPNFAHWRIRLALLWGGRMPVTRLLPVAWYETPNIHHVTVSDFRDLVREKQIRVEQSWYLSGDKPTSDAAASWRAEHAIFLISRG
jgi:methionine biosynthesis protein MetW